MHLVYRYQLDHLSQLGNFKGQSTEGLCHTSLAHSPPLGHIYQQNLKIAIGFSRFASSIFIYSGYMDIHHSY